MTDKIIIDGLACVNCPEAKRCQEQQAKKEYAINQVLQDIPTEYDNVVARLKQIIPSVTRCDYVLEKQLKRKEQECEELKKQLTILDDEDVVVEITVKQFEEYKKLKAENKELSEELDEKYDQAIKCHIKYSKYKQALKEIKEIAEWHTTKADSEDVQEDMKQILQKISEVEDGV